MDNHRVMLNSCNSRPIFFSASILQRAKSAFASLGVALLLCTQVASPAHGYVFLSDPPASGYAMNLNLGTATVQTTGFGATTWNALAQNALAAWNQVGVGPQQDHNFFSVRTPTVSGNACAQDGVNQVTFSNTLCGFGFGSALAVTQEWSVNGQRVEEDVIFDSTRAWDAYAGPLQGGKVDFYRVALHEFGHVVGLDHPDQWGQAKQSLMNSTVSNFDAIQQDDIDGAHLVNWSWFNFQTQYGVAPNTPVTSNSITVTGISTPTPISVTGGQYSINGSAWTSMVGTVSNGQTVALRVTSSSAAMTATTATLGIGAASGDFSAITAGNGAPIVINTSGYDPLADGSSKTYRKNGVDGYTETVLAGTTTINSIATKSVQDFDGKVSYSTNDANGIRGHRGYDPNYFIPGLGIAPLTFTMSPPLLNVPAIATLGQVVNSTGMVNYAIPSAGINSNLSYSSNTTPEAFETITVPAGTFNTVRVSSILNISGTINGSTINQTATEIQWVADGVGTVKSVSASSDITTYLLVGSNLLPVTNIAMGWNLIGNSVNAPLDVAATLGDATKVTTVWKWIPATSKWAFYAPSMTAPNLAAYAASKNYDVLTTINGGEGFWVNAKQPFTAQLPAGTAITTNNFQDQLISPNRLPMGWSLISTGDNPTPSAFNQALGVTPPAQGVIPLNITTLWTWDSGLSKWYFYAPSLDSNGTLASYITSKNYLNFGTNTLASTTGFWVNHP